MCVCMCVYVCVCVCIYEDATVITLGHINCIKKNETYQSMCKANHGTCVEINI